MKTETGNGTNILCRSPEAFPCPGQCRETRNRPCVSKQPGYSDLFPYDIQRIDMDIAAAHFDHSAKEKGIKGRFDPASELLLDFPDHFEYAYSWLRM
jgi:hypothetical protein